MTAQRDLNVSTPGVDVLDIERCRHLLRTHEFGRLAVRRGDSVDIFPINYLVVDDELSFRTGPGSKIVDLTASPLVAFEIDGRSGRRLWSVVVHGTARRLSADDEIDRSGVVTLRTAHPGDKFNYVTISPETVSGREFPVARRRWNPGSIVIAGAVVVVLIAAVGILSQALVR